MAGLVCPNSKTYYSLLACLLFQALHGWMGLVVFEPSQPGGIPPVGGDCWCRPRDGHEILHQLLGVTTVMAPSHAISI